MSGDELWLEGHEIEETARRYAEGAIAPPARGRVELHLVHCSACRGTLAGVVRFLLRGPTPAEARILSAVEAATARASRGLMRAGPDTPPGRVH